MNPDTFKGKVWLIVIDKVIIGVFVAIILVGLQYLSHKYQEILDASISVSKIYTGIILKQREDIIDLMEKYFLLLEKIKAEGKAPTKKQKKSIDETLYKVNFIKDTLYAVTLQDKPKKPLKPQLKKAKEIVDITAKGFQESISEMNMFLLELGPDQKLVFAEFDPKFDAIKRKYRDLLEALRDISIITVRTEIKAIY